ncbi:MAG: hypothetical protein HKO57_14480, partial [Akkermansiaceae bacterium]|nr:hypothetical protein [Akkermansiaceae bacterium]
MRSSMSFKALLAAAVLPLGGLHGQAPDPADLYAWFRADAGVSLDGNGFVTRWANQAATGTPADRDLDRVDGVPTTATWDTTTGGTASVISLNGASALWAAVGNFGGVSGDRSVAVYLHLNGTGDGYLFDGSTNSGMTRAHVAAGNWEVGIQASGNGGNPDPVTTTIVPNDWQLHIFSFQDLAVLTRVTHHVDGVLVGSHDLTETNPHSGFIVGGDVGAGRHLDVDIAECLVYPTLVDAATRADLQAYLDGKWGNLVPPPPPPAPPLDPSLLYAWYRGNTGVGTNASGAVLSWDNQATTGSPATRDLNRIFGNPRAKALQLGDGSFTEVIRFDGSSALWQTSGSWGELNDDRSYVFHLRLNDTTDGFLFDGSTNTGMTRACVAAGEWQAGIQPPPISNTGNPDPATDSAVPNAWQTHVFTYDLNGTQFDITHFVEGTQVGSHTIGIDDPHRGFIMGANVQGANHLHVDVAEAIVYDRVLDATERAEVEAHLAAEWDGLTEFAMSYEGEAVGQTARTVPVIGIHDVAHLRLDTIGDLDPVHLTGLTFNLNGTTDLADIAEARLYASANDPVFTPGTAPIATFTPPLTGSLTFSGSQPLASGANRIWVAVVLDAGAPFGNLVDAEILDFTIDGPQAGTVTPAVTAPPGELTVGDAIFRNVIRKRGDDGVHTYRIPGLATTNAGTLIAVFDNRNSGSGDLPGNVDVGVMRSTDGGITWDPMQVIMDYDASEPGSSGNGVGDPAVLVDRATGRIWVAALWSFGNNGWTGSGPGLDPADTGQFVLNYSDDDGLTWSEPVSITPDTKDPAWRLFFQGPGKGFTMRDGTLIFPSQFKDSGGIPHSNFIWSTDHGATWGVADPPVPGGVPQTTEAQMVELNDGSLLISMRNHDAQKKRAWSIYSWDPATETIADGTWSPLWYDQNDPTVMASVDRHSSVLDGHPYNVLLFANPDNPGGRSKMTIRVSTDEGQTWAYSRKIDDRPAAYSCLTVLDNGDIGLFYETGNSGAYETITFVRVPLEWIVGRDDTDGDGMLDFYEDTNGLDRNVDDALLDLDGDGFTNRHEHDAQTRANDATSFFTAWLDT